MTRALRMLALGAALVGCGGASDGAFSPMYPDNQAASIEDVAARLAAAGPRDVPAVAVGLADTTLYAVDLESGAERWRQTVTDPQTAPSIVGPLVLLHEGNRVVARRLSDGQPAFDLDDDRLHLVGGDGEGDVGVFVLSTTGGGGAGAHSRVYLTQGTRLATRFELDHPVGVPAVAAGMVFVPWGSQNISVIDVSQGQEIARVRSLAGVVSHALVRGGHLYFGQAGVGRMNPHMGGGSPDEVGWTQPETDELPGSPPLWRSAYDNPAGADSAVHRIRVEWTPAGADGAVRWADDTVYVTFYSFVFGLDAESMSVRWVRQLEHDVVGAVAREGGLLVADDHGGITYLGAADGVPRWSAETNAEPSVVALQLGGFTPSGSPSEEAPFLAEQLLAAAQNTDARLVPARAFAVHALAGQPDAAVTDHLLVLCDDRTLPDPLRAEACTSLASRELGPGAILRGLRRHAAYLDDTTVPPVGALATAAARMGERQAVPLLVSHLNDPNTPAQDLGPLAAALGALGERSAVRPLSDFLWLYHADVPDELFARGLQAVARALVTLQGPPARELISEIIEAPFTPADMVGRLRDVLTDEPTESEESEESEETE